VLLALAFVATALTPQFDTTFAVQRGQRLELSTHSGDVVVHTWSRNAVRVQGSGEHRSRIQVDQTASLVSIHSGGARGGPDDVDYELTIPAWMGIRLSGVTSSIRVDGIQGTVSAETVEGDVTVVGGSGLVSLRSVQGDVALSGASGKIDVNSVNSDVSVHDVAGELQAETVNGDVKLIRVQSDNVEANTVNGEITYDGTIRANGRYRFSSHNGGLTVTIPERTGALVSVSTFQGDFESAFPVTLTERHGKRFDFTIGNGSARVELESFSGTIRLTRPGTQSGRHRNDEKDADHEN
jgi:DUF4097 and DUF4098 domain-containing protein YvlB